MVRIWETPDLRHEQLHCKILAMNNLLDGSVSMHLLNKMSLTFKVSKIQAILNVSPPWVDSKLFLVNMFHKNVHLNSLKNMAH